MALSRPYMLYAWVGRWDGSWKPLYLAMNWEDLLDAVRRYRAEFAELPDWELWVR